MTHKKIEKIPPFKPVLDIGFELGRTRFDLIEETINLLVDAHNATEEDHIAQMDKMETIDTSKAWIPNGYTLVENRSLGKIDIKNLSLFAHEKQKGGYVNGEELRKALDKPLTSSVLQYLLENPKLMPEQWKEKKNGYTTFIYFHGTVLEDSFGYRYVPYLFWLVSKWYWDVGWLDRVFVEGGMSAVLASSSQSSARGLRM